MESISNAELLEIIVIAFSELEALFQYWLSVTFALLVASFVAKEYFSNNVRIIIGTLYTVSTAIAVYRYTILGVNGLMLVDELSSRGVQWAGINVWVGGARVALIVLGSITTIWFLYSTGKPKGQNGANET